MSRPDPRASLRRQSRKSSTVHFSHHLCLQHSEGSLEPNDGRRPMGAWDAHRAEFGEDYDYRSPEHIGCRYSAMVTHAPVFTTVAADVTCPKCREEWKGDTLRAWKASSWRNAKKWRSDEELTIGCWYVCCRHRCSVSPFTTPAEEQQFLLDMRAKALLKATKEWSFVVLLGMGRDKYERLVPGIEQRIAKLDPEDQAKLTRYLEQAKSIDELLAEASDGLAKLDELAHMAALAVQHPRQPRAKGRPTPKLTKVVGDLAKLSASAA